MSTKEEQQREKYFEEFGKHLVQRHGHNYVARAQGRLTVADPVARRFGRYLRAVRCSTGLTPAELAYRAKISAADLQALEQGIIPSNKISSRWLKALASVLNKNNDEFGLLLGQRPKVTRRTGPVFNIKKLLNVGFLSQPAFATITAMLLCVLISVALLAESHWKGVAATPPVLQVKVTAQRLAVDSSQVASTLVSVDAELRQNLIRAEKQKVLLQEFGQTPSGEPLLIVPDFGYRMLVTEKSTDAAPKEHVDFVHTFDFFNNPLLLLWTLSRFTPDGRFNLANAEYGVENQILVLPKIINVGSEERMNMVKAEIRL